MSRPSCSIVIPVYNRSALTQQCLDALLASPPTEVAYEIIVVDDASTDATQDVLASYGTRVRVVTHATNTGFSTACNDGAMAATHDYVVFLNNDTIPVAGWLDALVAYAERHPRAAVVGAKLLFPNDTIQHAGVVIGQDRQPRHIYAGFPADHPAVNTSRQFQIITAACALVRRERFVEIGCFDTAFVNGYEDVDLCLRFGASGHEIHYCHESVLYHFESASRERSERDDRNAQLYVSRWADRVQPDDVTYYLQDGLLNLSYPKLYPLQLSVSPHLALVERDGDEAHRLLNLRARQVWKLLKENLRLSVEALDADRKKKRVR